MDATLLSRHGMAVHCVDVFEVEELLCLILSFMDDVQAINFYLAFKDSMNMHFIKKKFDALLSRLQFRECDRWWNLNYATVRVIKSTDENRLEFLLQKYYDAVFVSKSVCMFCLRYLYEEEWNPNFGDACIHPHKLQRANSCYTCSMKHFGIISKSKCKRYMHDRLKVPGGEAEHIVHYPHKQAFLYFLTDVEMYCKDYKGKKHAKKQRFRKEISRRPWDF
jgi:hypothetical protein